MNRIKNAKKQTVDGILFLQGVFKTDCDKIEDFFHERLLHGNTTTAKYYDKIPLTFTNIDDWPKTTNLLCRNCNRVPKARPWFEPQSIAPISRGYIGKLISSKDLVRKHISHDYCMNVKGVFCTANCVMRYTLTNSKDLSDRLNKIQMLLILHEIFTGRTVTNIEPSPVATEMIQYGGLLSEADYQKKIDDINTTKHSSENFVSSCKAYFSQLALDD